MLVLLDLILNNLHLWQASFIAAVGTKLCGLSTITFAKNTAHYF